MKHEVREILGRTITGIIIKAGAPGVKPQSMLILRFADGTDYEFYSSDGHITTTAGVWHRSVEDARRYLDTKLPIIFEAHLTPDQGVLPFGDS
jgi:hypothetical protein